MTRHVNRALTIFRAGLAPIRKLAAGRLVLRLARRRGGTGGRTVEAAGLVDRGLEVAVAVAERHPALADRHAAIGFALDAAIDGDELIARAFDLNLTIHQHLAVAVHGDEIGRAVTLAGDDDDAAALQGHVRDQRVSDHDGGDLGGKLHELCLIDIDGDTVGIGRGQADGRPQQDSTQLSDLSRTVRYLIFSNSSVAH